MNDRPQMARDEVVANLGLIRFRVLERPALVSIVMGYDYSKVEVEQAIDSLVADHTVILSDLGFVFLPYRPNERPDPLAVQCLDDYRAARARGWTAGDLWPALLSLFTGRLAGPAWFIAVVMLCLGGCLFKAHQNDRAIAPVERPAAR